MLQMGQTKKKKQGRGFLITNNANFGMRYIFVWLAEISALLRALPYFIKYFFKNQSDNKWSTRKHWNTELSLTPRVSPTWLWFCLSFNMLIKEMSLFSLFPFAIIWLGFSIVIHKLSSSLLFFLCFLGFEICIISGLNKNLDCFFCSPQTLLEKEFLQIINVQKWRMLKFLCL